MTIAGKEPPVVKEQDAEPKAAAEKPDPDNVRYCSKCGCRTWHHGAVCELADGHGQGGAPAMTNMRPLVIDDDAKAKAAAVVAYAEHHRYRPGAPIPGNNPNFVATLGTYRAVFTITHAGGMIFRHLSVSVPGGKYPNVVAVLALADLFGFTGWDGRVTELPDGWVAAVKEDEHCVVVAQVIGSEGGRAH